MGRSKDPALQLAHRDGLPRRRLTRQTAALARAHQHCPLHRRSSKLAGLRSTPPGCAVAAGAHVVVAGAGEGLTHTAAAPVATAEYQAQRCCMAPLLGREC